MMMTDVLSASTRGDWCLRLHDKRRMRGNSSDEECVCGKQVQHNLLRPAGQCASSVVIPVRLMVYFRSLLCVVFWH